MKYPRGLRVVWEDLQHSVENRTLLENGTILQPYAPYGFKATVSFPIYDGFTLETKNKVIYFETLSALSFYFNFLTEVLKLHPFCELEYVGKNDFIFGIGPYKIKFYNCTVSVTHGLIFFELQVEDNPRFPFFTVEVLIKFLESIIEERERSAK
jgi:hypothetical protein